MSLNDLYNEVTNEIKKVVKQTISNNPVTLKSYEINLKAKYNNYISFIIKIWDTLDRNLKDSLTEQIIRTKSRIRASYTRLGVPLLHTPHLLDHISTIEIETHANDLPDNSLFFSYHHI